MYATDLIGRKVGTEEDKPIGKISNFEVNTKNWKVKRITISLDKPTQRKLEYKAPIMEKVKFTLSTDKLSSTDKMILLHTTLEEIEHTIREQRRAKKH